MVMLVGECSRYLLALPVMGTFLQVTNPLLGGLRSAGGQTIRYMPESAVCQPDSLQLSLCGEALASGPFMVPLVLLFPTNTP